MVPAPMFKIQQSSDVFTRWFSGCLALLVLLLSLAAFSPQLHRALHAEAGCQHNHDRCGGHGQPHESQPPLSDCGTSCAVVLFDQGLTAPQLLIALPERTDVIVAVIALSAAIVWSGQRWIRLCSRAPPIEMLVK